MSHSSCTAYIQLRNGTPKCKETFHLSLSNSSGVFQICLNDFPKTVYYIQIKCVKVMKLRVILNYIENIIQHLTVWAHYNGTNNVSESGGKTWIRGGEGERGPSSRPRNCSPHLCLSSEGASGYEQDSGRPIYHFQDPGPFTQSGCYQDVYMWPYNRFPLSVLLPFLRKFQ